MYDLYTCKHHGNCTSVKVCTGTYTRINKYLIQSTQCMSSPYSLKIERHTHTHTHTHTNSRSSLGKADSTELSQESLACRNLSLSSVGEKQSSLRRNPTTLRQAGSWMAEWRLDNSWDCIRAIDLSTSSHIPCNDTQQQKFNCQVAKQKSHKTGELNEYNTNEAKKSFQRLKCMHEYYLGCEKVSCLQRCPQESKVPSIVLIAAQSLVLTLTMGMWFCLLCICLTWAHRSRASS